MGEYEAPSMEVHVAPNVEAYEAPRVEVYEAPRVEGIGSVVALTRYPG